MLSQTQKVFIAVGLVSVIIFRWFNLLSTIPVSQNSPHKNQQAITIIKKRKKSLIRKKSTSEAEKCASPIRNYEDEIRELSRSLSDADVPLNFPYALEILLDFTFLDVDEGNEAFNMQISVDPQLKYALLHINNMQHDLAAQHQR